MTFYFSYFLLVSTCILASLAESNYFAFDFLVITQATGKIFFRCYTFLVWRCLNLYPFGKRYNS